MIITVRKSLLSAITMRLDMGYPYPKSVNHSTTCKIWIRLCMILEIGLFHWFAVHVRLGTTIIVACAYTTINPREPLGMLCVVCMYVLPSVVCCLGKLVSDGGRTRKKSIRYQVRWWCGINGRRWIRCMWYIFVACCRPCSKEKLLIEMLILVMHFSSRGT